MEDNMFCFEENFLFQAVLKLCAYLYFKLVYGYNTRTILHRWYIICKKKSFKFDTQYEIAIKCKIFFVNIILCVFINYFMYDKISKALYYYLCVAN